MTNATGTSIHAIDLPSAGPATLPGSAPVVIGAAGTANLPVPVIELRAVQAEDSLVSIRGITPADVAEIAKMRETVDFDNAQSVYTFANGILEQNSQVVDQLLQGVSTGRAGLGGDLVIALKQGVSEFQQFDFAKIKAELAINPRTQEGSLSTYLRKAPLVGKFFSQLEYLKQRHDAILKLFDAIASKAKDRRRIVIEDVTKVEFQRKSARGYLRQLGLAIIAGSQALLAGKAEYDAKAQALARDPDPVEIGMLRTRHGNIIQFEDRLVNLQLALTRGVTVTETEMQMAAEAGNIAIGKIENMLTIDLPQFKTAIFAVLVASDIKRAQVDGDDFNKAADQAANVAAELMGDVLKSAKASQGDVLEKVQHLAEVGAKLIASMDEGLTLEEQATEKRAQAQQLLLEVKKNYTKGMLAVAEKHGVK